MANEPSEVPNLYRECLLTLGNVLDALLKDV